MKVTFEAPANIAFVKYWGVRDLASALPANASVSMTLDRCLPQFLLAENDWRKTNHWIILVFFVLCCSIRPDAIVGPDQDRSRTGAGRERCTHVVASKRCRKQRRPRARGRSGPRF